MDCDSLTEMTMDSIDVTIFEDFFSLDITMPFTCDTVKSSLTEKPNLTPVEPVKTVLSTEVDQIPTEHVDILPSTQRPDASSIQPAEMPEISTEEVEKTPGLVEFSDPTPIEPEVTSIACKEVIQTDNTELLLPTEESISILIQPMEALKLPDEVQNEIQETSIKNETSHLMLTESLEKTLEFIDLSAETKVEPIEVSIETDPIVMLDTFDLAVLSSNESVETSLSVPTEVLTPVQISKPNNSVKKATPSGSHAVTPIERVNTFKSPELPSSTPALSKSVSLPKSAFKSSKKQPVEQNSTVKSNSLPKLLSNSPLVPHAGPGSIFSPSFSANRPRPTAKYSSCRKRILIDEPLIQFSPDVIQRNTKPSTINRANSSTNFPQEMKENKMPSKSPFRFESPTEIHKSLVLNQVSGRTKHSPLYTPFTSMVTRFKQLSIESPFVPANKNNLTNVKTGQAKSQVEKVKLLSPLLRSPKLKVISAKHPLRSNSKVNNSVEKKSPTITQYKAKTPVIQGSRIPVLKLI